MPVQPHNKEASDRRRARAASNTSKPLDALVEQTHKHTWFFTFLRELSMEMILAPLARKTGLTKAKQGRFMEQCYDVLHFGFSGVFGVVSTTLEEKTNELVRDVTDTDVAV
jgi:hypothetical protein